MYFAVWSNMNSWRSSFSRLYVQQVSFCPPLAKPFSHSESGSAVKHSALFGLRAPATPPMLYM